MSFKVWQFLRGSPARYQVSYSLRFALVYGCLVPEGKVYKAILILSHEQGAFHIALTHS